MVAVAVVAVAAVDEIGTITFAVEIEQAPDDGVVTGAAIELVVDSIAAAVERVVAVTAENIVLAAAAIE